MHFKKGPFDFFFFFCINVRNLFIVFIGSDQQSETGKGITRDCVSTEE